MKTGCSGQQRDAVLCRVLVKPAYFLTDVIACCNASSDCRPCMLCWTAGTGKTLVARALAAQASRAGRKVSFFMRKGADVLSKWVGEAERQLRLLFEEARKAQPSIIFFDEIDGLAPVRSTAWDWS